MMKSLSDQNNNSNNSMAAVDIPRLPNPFLKSNPFTRCPKFHSQPKPSAAPQFDQFEYSLPFVSNNMSSSLKKNPFNSSSSLTLAYSKAQSRGQLSQITLGYQKHPQKDKKLSKHSMKMKQNPFLRKHLVPASKENTLPEELPVSRVKLEEKHRQLFGSLPKDSSPHSYQDQYLISIKCSPQMTSPKKKSQIPRRSFERQTDRSMKSPEQITKNYQSSELQIKLKSQTLIEAEQIVVGQEDGQGIIFPIGTTSFRGKSQREPIGDDPDIVKYKGKSFYLVSTLQKI